jgi:Flp pilus assembly protein TadG
VEEMTSLAERARDERGLMGKIAILWLVLLALFVVAAIDTGSILYSRFKVADAADTASFEAATAYGQGQDSRVALQVATDKVAELLPDAHIPKDGVVINAETGEVTVTVVRKAWTLVAGRLGFTKHFTKVSATDTNGPSTL